MELRDAASVARAYKDRTGKSISAERVKRFAQTRRLVAVRSFELPLLSYPVTLVGGASTSGSKSPNVSALLATSAMNAGTCSWL
jgi:hypothetical protein